MKPKRGTCKYERKTVFMLEGVVRHECGLRGNVKCDKAKCADFCRAERVCSDELAKIVKEARK